MHPHVFKNPLPKSNIFKKIEKQERINSKAEIYLEIYNPN